jgi:hypothetical protein
MQMGNTFWRKSSLMVMAGLQAGGPQLSHVSFLTLSVTMASDKKKEMLRLVNPE